ncbi:MAG: hypothetical protein A2017_05010 [Lentisphaerae bacterium GWF2_44_16]|nr:MAG: hypothetical protein A2017_05010 [Lentisphaerae bacterium GWF2_44_16]
MPNLKKISVICMIALSIAVLNAKEINVPKTLQAPVIDGKASDTCWETVPWNGGFDLLGHDNIKAPVETRFKILHDNKKLYFLIVSDEPFMNKIKADAQHDSGVYADDSIEVFLNASDDNTTYHQFIFNSKGIVYDAACTQGGVVKYVQWDSALQLQTFLDKDKWILEVAIPIVELNVNSKKWRFNIGRNRTIDSHRTYTFSGLFDQPDTFAWLNFVDADFTKYNINIKPFYNEETILRNNKAYFTAKTFIQNNTDKTLFIKLDAGLSKGGSSQTRNGISSNTGQEIIMDIPVKEEGFQQAYIKVYDYQTGELLGRIEREIEIKIIVLKIKLTTPAYRSNIYATQKINEIAGNIIACLEDLSNTSLAITLSSSNKEIIRTVKIKKTSRHNNFSLPVKDLKSGCYTLDVKLLQNDQELYSNSTVINKLPEVAEEYRLDKNGNVLHNGKFFMPYGWFSIRKTEEWEQEQREGLNIIFDYGAYFKNDEQLKIWMDTAHQTGIKVVIKPYPKRSMEDGKEWAKPLSDNDALAIREFVDKWKNHPALAAWYLADEPLAQYALSARLEAIYKIVSNADPYHPTIILEDIVGGIYKYADYCDILMADPYPLFAKDAYAVRKMEYISRFTSVVDSFKGKGHWMTPQAFNYGDFGAPNNRAPNFTELRCQQYQVIIGGATGIIWWAHYVGKKYPACLFGVRYLAKEAELLKPVIEQNSQREILETSDKLLMAAYYKNINGHDYVIAVNTKVATLNEKIILPADKTWYVMSENRQVQSNGKFLEDKFDIYDVHIYTTNKDIANKLSISKTQQQIKDDE